MTTIKTLENDKKILENLLQDLNSYYVTQEIKKIIKIVQFKIMKLKNPNQANLKTFSDLPYMDQALLTYHNFNESLRK